MENVADPGPKRLRAGAAVLRTMWTQRLAGPLVAASVVRLTLVGFALARGGVSVLFRPDTVSYLKPGQSIFLHGAYISDGAPEIFRPPGYPLFLGLTTLAGGPVLAVLGQILLSLVSLVLVWRMARRMFADDRIALGASWIFAFEPLSVSYSVVLLSETLFLCLFLLSMERLVEFLHSHRLAALAAAGIWLTAATFVRPVTCYLLFVLVMGLAVAFARFPSLRWKAPALFLIATVPWVALWQLRNRMETGFGGFSSVAAVNLYRYQAVAVTAGLEHRPALQVQKEFDDRIGFAELSEIDEAKRMHGEGMRIVRAHPAEFVRGQLIGAVEVALKPGAAELLNLLGTPENAEELAFWGLGGSRAALQLREHPLRIGVMVLLELILAGLYVLAGLAIVQKSFSRVIRWGILGTVLYFLAANSGVLSRGRFRIPIMALVCILASAGLEQVRTVLKRQARGSEMGRVG